ncbi:ParB/RepB/Spo0J family partition protein [Zooshikella ganghwensis]|uniref:ParB/RepB/Spo0J family partition protein n=1 Tax=Zooshikella ganghwensis TaxID=202772 RepID=A0A4P9VI12_9GAMM|nr:ParB/RepB/Spo0J family partition protein [Zooshikella ganghwensis]RDH41807.1 ParB/RepB/Spo0J family partition protein [Zooshikella ganghwensis]
MLKGFKVQKGATKAQLEAVRDEVVTIAKSEGRYLELGPNQLEPDPNQPRKTFDEQGLQDLQRSIEARGQLQPILIGEQGDSGKYPIISGERRWRAISNSSTVKTVSAIVRSGASDELLLLLMQIDENNQREQVPAIENAEAMQRVVDICKTNGNDQAYAASILGVSKGHLSKYLALLKAPDSIKQLSLNNETQDVVTLYDLTRAYQKDQKAVDSLVNQWKSGELIGTLRKASRELAESPKKGPQKKKVIPIVKQTELVEQGGDIQLKVTLDKKVLSFSLTDDALNALKKGLKLQKS